MYLLGLWESVRVLICLCLSVPSRFYVCEEGGNYLGLDLISLD